MDFGTLKIIGYALKYYVLKLVPPEMGKTLIFDLGGLLHPIDF